MKKIKEIIVVEGRDDITAVKSAVDAEIIAVHGYSVFKRENIEKIRVAEKNRGIIVLTDPDYAGIMIRKHIHKFFPNAKDAYISRKEGTKKDNIGVENATPEAIIKALENAHCTLCTEKNIFTMQDLIKNGLNGGTNAKEKREKLTSLLGIGYGSSKQLLSKLNRYGISREEFLQALKKL